VSLSSGICYNVAVTYASYEVLSGDFVGSFSHIRCYCLCEGCAEGTSELLLHLLVSCSLTVKSVNGQDVSL
jgi:hypothetical protein